MLKKILVTLVSFGSIPTAQAAEVWIRASGRLFKADVRANEDEMVRATGSDLIELLRGAEVKEVSPPHLLPHGMGDSPSWTEPQCPATQAPAASPSAGIGTWTEARHRVESHPSWTEVGSRKPRK